MAMQAKEETDIQSKFEAARDKAQEAFKEQRYQEAKALFTEALELQPDKTAFSNRSATHCFLEDYKAALEDAEKCIELDPFWPRGFSRAGYALLKLGRLEEAQRMYSTGLEMDPLNHNMLQALDYTSRLLDMRQEQAGAAKEDSKQKDMHKRDMIRAIMKDTSLSAAEKNHRIQQLHMPKEVAAPPLVRTLSEEQQMQATYHDGFKASILGCKHYQRKCKMQADCCGVWYTCRLCHDEAVGDDHKIDRQKTKNMMCMLCQHVQPAAQKCANCDTCLALHYCDVCKFWDDYPDRDIYHCDKCGICRRGRAGEFFHCDRCDVCLSVEQKDSHVCLAGSAKSNCPICHEAMFHSRKPMRLLPCGHTIHVACLAQYARTNYVCPLCNKSIQDMRATWRMLEQELEMQPMPEEYRDWVSRILCNDCVKHGHAPYHFVYLQCEFCGGFNTNTAGAIIKDNPGLAAELRQKLDERRTQRLLEEVGAPLALGQEDEQQDDDDDDEEEEDDSESEDDEDEEEEEENVAMDNTDAQQE